MQPKGQKQPAKQHTAFHNSQKEEQEDGGKEQQGARTAEQALPLRSPGAQHHTHGAALKEFQVPYFNLLIKRGKRLHMFIWQRAEHIQRNQYKETRGAVLLPDSGQNAVGLLLNIY